MSCFPFLPDTFGSDDLEQDFENMERQMRAFTDRTDDRLKPLDEGLRERVRDLAQRSRLCNSLARAQRSRREWDCAIRNAMEAVRLFYLAAAGVGLYPDAALGLKVRNANPLRLSEEDKAKRADRWNDLARPIRERNPKWGKSAVANTLLKQAIIDPETREALSKPDGTLYSAYMIRTTLE